MNMFRVSNKMRTNLRCFALACAVMNWSIDQSTSLLFLSRAGFGVASPGEFVCFFYNLQLEQYAGLAGNISHLPVRRRLLLSLGCYTPKDSERGAPYFCMYFRTLGPAMDTWPLSDHPSTAPRVVGTFALCGINIMWLYRSSLVWSGREANHVVKDFVYATPLLHLQSRL